MRTLLTSFNVVAVLNNQADRHMTSIENLTVAELRDELDQRKLSTKGKKMDLLVRLKETLGNNAQPGRGVIV